MLGSSTLSVAVTREKEFLFYSWPQRCSQGEAPEQCQMVLEELFPMESFLLPFPRSLWQGSIGSIYTWELDGQSYLWLNYKYKATAGKDSRNI